MRLINVFTLEQREFVKHKPPYAILSHRWEDGEISYQDYQDPLKRQGRGYEKIRNFCQLLSDMDHHQLLNFTGLRSIEWSWVDTCCIDKSSSAELSESINSIAQWYQESTVCVAYLSDVGSLTDGLNEQHLLEALRSSAWFYRGWTLQELLFANYVTFCIGDWTPVKRLTKDSKVISDVTGIPVECLKSSKKISNYSVARRMTWAASRHTTRQEDTAYCLLGLFDIKMPLLYGEGGLNAFHRLQEAIIKRSDDDSILFWQSLHYDEPSVLAVCPADFARAGGESVTRHKSSNAGRIYRLTEEGIEISAKVITLQTREGNRFHDGSKYRDIKLVELDCHYFDPLSQRLEAAVIVVTRSARGKPWHRWASHLPLRQAVSVAWAAEYMYACKTDGMRLKLAMTDRDLSYLNGESAVSAPDGLHTIADIFNEMQTPEWGSWEHRTVSQQAEDCRAEPM